MMRLMQLFLAILIGLAFPATAASVTLSTGQQVCTASQVVITCQGEQPPQETCAQFIDRMYVTYLGRHPQGGEDAYWLQQCNYGPMTRAQIEDAFKTYGPPVPPNPQPPSGCNVGAIQPALAWGEVRQQRAQPGQVMAFPLNQTEPASRASLTFTQGQQPATPPGAITEFSVSACPGVIDTTLGACYYRGTFVNNNTIDIYRRNVGVAGCMATNAAATYYVNVRWTFDSCPWGAGACGFSLQWATGPW